MIVRRLSKSPDATAPDGSEVCLLASGERGSMAHFTLPPGKISKAVAHRSVEEVWFIIAGRGRMWRKRCDEEGIVDLEAGVSIDIPLGTHFQFRCDGTEPLQAVGVTMPPWPGMDEAYAVEEIWQASA